MSMHTGEVSGEKFVPSDLPSLSALPCPPLSVIQIFGRFGGQLDASTVVWLIVCSASEFAANPERETVFNTFRRVPAGWGEFVETLSVLFSQLACYKRACPCAATPKRELGRAGAVQKVSAGAWAG